MVVGLLGNESPDSNRIIPVTPKSENDVRLQATLGNQNLTGLPVGAVRFPDYHKLIETAKDEPITVGALVLVVHGSYMIAPFNVVPGFDAVLVGTPGIYSPGKNINANEVNMYSFMSFAKSCISTWYGIQIALLHPVLKEVFANPKQTLIYDANNKNKKSKRKVRYIKKHVIKDGAIDNALSEVCENQKKGFSRHTLVWYVIGHWRHYENGKKIFVKGYWKGALRELKKNMDEGRDRDIAQVNKT